MRGLLKAWRRPSLEEGRRQGASAGTDQSSINGRSPWAGSTADGRLRVADGRATVKIAAACCG